MLLIVLLMRMASAPSYTTLVTGIDPAQTGKVTAALDQKGIGYELQNNGTALAVEKGKTAQARIALASAGAARRPSAQPGFELFDKQKLGTSNFQQQVNYQRALEGEIAKTIEQVAGRRRRAGAARAARTRRRSSSPTTPARRPRPCCCRARPRSTPARCAASRSSSPRSVPGLKTDNVTITDGSGQLLWPNGAGGSGADSGGLLAKQAAEARYDQQHRLQPRRDAHAHLGPDKAQVQVHADLDANQATQEQLTYGKKGVALAQKTETETLKGGGGSGGAAGTGAQHRPAYAQTGAGGNSNYKHDATDATFGVDKTVTHTKVAPGAVNSQQVSVLLDKSVPASAIPQIQAAVASAAGIDAKRGDTLSVGQVAFAEAAAAAAAPSPVATFGGYVKYALLGLGALGFLFFITRQLRKREQETLAGEPTWLREIEAPRTLAELERLEADDHPAHVRPLRTPEQPARAARSRTSSTRDPDRVAQQVRAWMSEDEQ